LDIFISLGDSRPLAEAPPTGTWISSIRRPGDGFARGQPGNPAAIFQRAFDDPNHGLHVIANLSLGGLPFPRDSRANLKGADFVIKWLRVIP
jgi:hypothetical protein